MVTLSVPVSSELDNFIKSMVRTGRAANKADVVRRALREYEENRILETILQAEREPTLHGDLKNLMKKFK